MNHQQARFWVQVIGELRNGVKLKKVEENLGKRGRSRGRGRGAEFELTPYEILMDDIRERRYRLRKTPAPVPNARKDARTMVLDFIRSRPPLKKVRRHLILNKQIIIRKKKYNDKPFSYRCHFPRILFGRYTLNKISSKILRVTREINESEMNLFFASSLDHNLFNLRFDSTKKFQTISMALIFLSTDRMPTIYSLIKITCVFFCFFFFSRTLLICVCLVEFSSKASDRQLPPAKKQSTIRELLMESIKKPPRPLRSCRERLQQQSRLNNSLSLQQGEPHVR